MGTREYLILLVSAMFCAPYVILLYKIFFKSKIERNPIDSKRTTLDS